MKPMIYIAGPLFSEAEKKQRLHEGKELRRIGFDTKNPIEMMQLGDEGFSPKTIFELDYDNAITKCSHFLFDLDNFDRGTFVEFGQVVERIKLGLVDPLKVVVVYGDKNRATNTNQGLHNTWGFNAYVTGALLSCGVIFAFDSEEAFTYLAKSLRTGGK